MIELPVDIVGEQTRRRIDGKLNGGGAEMSLETVNGGVKIGKLRLDDLTIGVRAGVADAA